MKIKIDADIFLNGYIKATVVYLVPTDITLISRKVSFEQSSSHTLAVSKY